MQGCGQRDGGRSRDGADAVTESTTTLAEDIAAVCEASYAAWQRARAEEADREVVAYLVRGFEQQHRAKTAAEKALALAKGSGQ